VTSHWVLALGGLLGLGCGGQPAVRIASPADGDSVTGSLLVRLIATGVRVVPATGVAVAGEGHHHVYVDVDPIEATGPILTGPGIYHLGKGVDSLRLDGLTAGPHRLIAVFASGDHVPMAGVRRDTARLVVRP
jgi:hypothetical protein